MDPNLMMKFWQMFAEGFQTWLYSKQKNVEYCFRVRLLAFSSLLRYFKINLSFVENVSPEFLPKGTEYWKEKC